MGRIHFGNLVEFLMAGRSGNRPLVSKVEKAEELFALDMERDQRPFSS